jgi:Transposase IS66 family
MTDHLQSQGYERVAIKRTQDARYLMLSLNAEATLDRFKWEALVLYAGDGGLEIDNNSPEWTLRPCAIERTGCFSGATGAGRQRRPS